MNSKIEELDIKINQGLQTKRKMDTISLSENLSIPNKKIYYCSSNLSKKIY